MKERQRGARRRRHADRSGRDRDDLSNLTGQALGFLGEISRLWLTALTRLPLTGAPLRARRRHGHAREGWDEGDGDDWDDRDDDRDDDERDEDEEIDRDEDDEIEDLARDDEDLDGPESRDDDDRDDDDEPPSSREPAPKHEREARSRGDREHRSERHGRGPRWEDEERALRSPEGARGSRRERRGGRSSTLGVSVEVSSTQPVEVSLKIERDMSFQGLHAQDLGARDKKKPALMAIDFDEVHGRPRLRVAVPPDQPEGVYAGAITDEQGEPCGTLRIKVGAAESGGDKHGEGRGERKASS